MSDTVVVTGRYSVKDYARANVFLQQRIFLYKYSWLVAGQLVLFALVAFFFIAPYAFASAFFNTFGVIFIVLIPIVSVIQYYRGRYKIPASTIRKMEKQIAETPVMQQSHTIAFSRDGISSTTPISSGNIEWPAIVEIADTEEDIYFFTGKRTAMFLPKWMLADDDGYARLKALIDQVTIAK